LVPPLFNTFMSVKRCEAWGLVDISPVLVVYISPFLPLTCYYTLYYVLAIAGQLPPTMSLV